MSWEYLLDNQLDFRVAAAIPYIYPLYRETHVFDLNCGHAPLLKYLPKLVQYAGNDILKERLPKNNKTSTFHAMTDEEVANDAHSRIDVLCCFGIGGYELTKESQESPTVTDSLIKIMDSKKPKLVVLEAIEEFESILERIKEKTNYLTVQKIYMQAEKPEMLSRISKRLLWILRPQAIDIG